MYNFYLITEVPTTSGLQIIKRGKNFNNRNHSKVLEEGRGVWKNDAPTTTAPLDLLLSLLCVELFFI